MRPSLVETYSNSLYLGHQCHRYWVGNFPIMVGGSLLGPADWEHLRDDFGITDVINVETEHDDSGKLPSANLLQARVPDDMSPFSEKLVLTVCLFGLNKLQAGGKVYVHCQMGGSRSPAFAYALLRAVYSMNREQALAVIRSCPGREGYGAPGHTHHTPYLASVDAALAPVFGEV
jgi:hypothetical protein